MSGSCRLRLPGNGSKGLSYNNSFLNKKKVELLLTIERANDDLHRRTNHRAGKPHQYQVENHIYLVYRLVTSFCQIEGIELGNDRDGLQYSYTVILM